MPVFFVNFMHAPAIKYLHILKAKLNEQPSSTLTAHFSLIHNFIHKKTIHISIVFD